MKNIKNITLQVAGFSIVVEFNEIKRQDRRIIRDQFIDFFINQFRLFITEDKVDKPDLIISFEHQEEYKMIVEHQGKMFYIETFSFASKKRIVSNYQINIYQIQLLLREALQYLLQQHDGFIFHTSAVIVENKAYLFMGDSGAGKSTVMHTLSKKYKPLADDTLIVRKMKGRYQAFYTPFIEKVIQFKKDSQSYSIDKVFFIKKSSDNKITPLSSIEIIIGKLAKQLLTNKEDYGKQMKSLLSFVSEEQKYFIWYLVRDEEQVLDFFDTMCVSS